MNMTNQDRSRWPQDGLNAVMLVAFGGFAVLCGCRSELITEEDKTESIVAHSGEPKSDPEVPSSRAESDQPPKPKFSGEALRLAAHDGKIEIVRQAIESGVDVQSTDAQGHTALHMAAYNGHSEIVKLLLKNGSQLDRRDGEGKTALIHASSGPFADAVEVLLEAGADVDIADRGEGFTALMTAASLGEKEVVAVLLEHGASKDLVDIDGDTARDFAVQRGHDDIVEMLEP
jgi:ankyrin repeat protein